MRRYSKAYLYFDDVPSIASEAGPGRYCSPVPCPRHRMEFNSLQETRVQMRVGDVACNVLFAMSTS